MMQLIMKGDVMRQIPYISGEGGPNPTVVVAHESIPDIKTNMELYPRVHWNAVLKILETSLSYYRGGNYMNKPPIMSRSSFWKLGNSMETLNNIYSDISDIDCDYKTNKCNEIAPMKGGSVRDPYTNSDIKHNYVVTHSRIIKCYNDDKYVVIQRIVFVESKDEYFLITNGIKNKNGIIGRKYSTPFMHRYDVPAVVSYIRQMVLQTKCLVTQSK